MNARAMIAAGDAARTGSEAFQCVASAWNSHESELRAYLRHRLADQAAADDVLQDVFFKALRHRSAFCGVDSPRAWLFQVARNTLVDRARTHHPAEPIADHQDRLAAPMPEPASPVDALAACMPNVMDRLPAADAAILRACDIEGLRQRDFAAAHSLTLAAVKSRLLRARQRLREQLVQDCGVEFDDQGRVCCHAVASGGEMSAGF